jgi:hypothetical protein
VQWVPADRLSALGIETVRGTERRVAMDHLKRLALGALMYADEHDNTFADGMGELKPYVGDDIRFAWIMANAEYLVAGVKQHDVSNPATRPLVYWKTTPTTLGGTVLVFCDGHAEFVPTDRLAEFGISQKP